METFKDFMIDQLRELYSAEIHLRKILCQMAEKTSNQGLKKAFELLSKEYETQSGRMGQIISRLGGNVSSDCQSYIMEGITREVQRFNEITNAAEIRDAGFVALIWKAKHYETALYSTLRGCAKVLNKRKESEDLTSQKRSIPQ